MKNFFTLKNIILILASLVLTPSLYAQVDDATSTSSTPNSLLWKIEGPDIKTSYVYGTIHWIPREDFFITESTEEAIDQSEKIVLELDIDDPDFQTDLLQLMTFTDGETLKDYCSEEEYAKLRKAIKGDSAMVEIMMPRFKPILLISRIMDESLTCQDPVNYELYFVEQAQKSDKEIIGLESPADQMAVFDNIPYDEQIDLIIETYIDSAELTGGQMDTLYQYYLAQDIQGLYDLSMSTEVFDDLLTRLFDDRNLDWSQQIPKLCRDYSCFIAVGAGHLAGPRGLLQLLREQDYTVTPMY